MTEAPLPVVGFVLLLALIAAVEFGYWTQSRLFSRRGTRGSSADEGYLLSAVLGLLALLLGFTFSLALNRYEARRELVVKEANALGTAWLRAQLLDEPQRSRTSALLRAYVDDRVLYSEDKDTAAAAEAAAHSVQIQQRLWKEVGIAMRADSSPLTARALMDPINESFDLASARAAARAAHIPDRVLSVLAIYAVISAAMLGYVLAASGSRQRIASYALLVLLTLAITVILDLDRPRSGAIVVSQQPIEELQASIRR